METDMTINPEKIRELRESRGWSQDQLARVSGLSLRTIQRVESEGRTSRETKVCLAATFDLEISDLDVDDFATPARDKAVPFKASKSVLSAGVVALAVSAFGYLRDSEPHLLFIVANMASIAIAMYLLFGWYFSGAVSFPDVLRRTVRVGIVYIACYSVFAMVGGLGTTQILTGLLSGSIFAVIYFFLDLKFSSLQRRRA